MISYSEAKRNLMFRVEALEETIKFLRENTYYEQKCKNCNSIMKIRVSKPSGKDNPILVSGFKLFSVVVAIIYPYLLLSSNLNSLL